MKNDKRLSGYFALLGMIFFSIFLVSFVSFVWPYAMIMLVWLREHFSVTVMIVSFVFAFVCYHLWDHFDVEEE